MTDFKNKGVLVTGAGNGIGRAAAVGFAKAGARVAVSDIDERGGRETVAQIARTGADALYIRCDVADPADVDAMFDQAAGHLGEIHHAVNNAGIDSEMLLEPAWDLDEFARIFAINVQGVFACMRREIPHMRKIGGGTIVNLSSLAGIAGVPSKPIYTSSKHAVLGMTRAAGLQYARDNLRINALCPGSTRTNMLLPTFDLIPGGEASVRAGTPCKRIAEPEEMAEAILWLSSEHARFVIGQGLSVDGGLSAGLSPWS
jgi:NAD(P)-dependent dehydrogenase (short-subunit alcohol dehydrogenase family)